ncbi:M24 family metallopeptidase [bacterium]|nr:M24 family metallopeptidase [candidate division CSSED10-310 bacterium]
MNIFDIQNALKETGLSAWLLTDYQLTNIPAVKLLGLDPSKNFSRRWFYLIPQSGDPIRLVNSVEAGVLDHLPGQTVLYFGRAAMISNLETLLEKNTFVAMEYSPMGRLPSVSRVDAGTIELVRSIGVDIISSADLLQRFTSRWDEVALESHRAAARVLRETVTAVWNLISQNLSGCKLSEFQIQQFMMNRFMAEGCVTDHPPIVAIDAHSADPHFAPTPDNTRLIGPNQLVLIDLWCRTAQHGSVYADITWTAWTGPDAPPPEIVKIFDIVRDARDQTVLSVKAAFETRRKVTGADLDRICRGIISDAGYGEFFVHRTGHSLDSGVHGAGANLDSLESEDDREIAACTGFTIEPGIYFPGRFGIRSELNVAILPDLSVEITGLPIQTELVKLS